MFRPASPVPKTLFKILLRGVQVLHLYKYIRICLCKDVLSKLCVFFLIVSRYINGNTVSSRTEDSCIRLKT